MSEQAALAPAAVRAFDTNEVSIALGIDRAYAPHAAAVIASAVRHALGARFRFLILHVGVERALQARVEQAAPDAVFIWREIGDADVPPMADREHFSRAILFRLGIEKYAPAEWPRLLYIDSDVIVNRDVRELWRADLDGKPIAAVIDCYVDPIAFAERWSLPADAPAYFNSGVLLIDLDRIRAERAFSEAIDFIVAHLDEVYLADQDALNYALWGRWKRLETIWNVQRHMVLPALVAQIDEQRRLGRRAPGIIHYTGPDKPWTAGYHPYSWLYWENLARTPFHDEVARATGIGPFKRFMLWQRWLRRRIS